MKVNKIFLLLIVSFFAASCNADQSTSQEIDPPSDPVISQTEETSNSLATEEENRSTSSEDMVIDISPIASVKEIILENEGTALVKPAEDEDSNIVRSASSEEERSSNTSASAADETGDKDGSDEVDTEKESEKKADSDETDENMNSEVSSSSDSENSQETSSDETPYAFNDLDSADVSGIDYSQYESVDQVIEDLIVEYGFDRSQLGIVFSNLITGETYQLNPDQASHAASTNKVGTSVMYVDLINQGLLEWDTMLPFSESYVEEGGGEITNNPFQSSYSVEDLLYNSLVFSDNTAWNMLINYYYENFGNFQVDLVKLGEIDEIPEALYNINYATPWMLNQILIKVATEPQYQPLVQYMTQAQPGQRFRLYVDEGMATKYGMYDTGYHDTGIYFDSNGQPIYTLVLMSLDLGMIDLFMGDLNLRVYEWTSYNLSS